MASTAELIDSRQYSIGKSQSAEMKYLITGTGSESAAIAQLSVDAPNTFQTYVLQSLKVEPIGDPTDTEMWYGTATYGPASYTPARETGDSVYSFDTGGGNTHITNGLEHVKSYDSGGEMTEGSANKWKCAINATGFGADMRVDGVDIIYPTYNFSETHYIDYDTVDQAFKLNIFNGTGKTNDGTFRGFAEGEVLFLGASGTVRGDDQDWEITYRFAASENKTGLSIGDITGIAKNGWEYLWVRYKMSKDTDGNPIQIPSEVHIERVYDDFDFDSLFTGL
jgi:hypothetical protein